MTIDDPISSLMHTPGHLVSTISFRMKQLKSPEDLESVPSYVSSARVIFNTLFMGDSHFFPLQKGEPGNDPDPANPGAREQEPHKIRKLAESKK